MVERLCPDPVVIPRQRICLFQERIGIPIVDFGVVVSNANEAYNRQPNQRDRGEEELLSRYPQGPIRAVGIRKDLREQASPGAGNSAFVVGIHSR